MVTRRNLLGSIGAGALASVAGCSELLLGRGHSDSVGISGYGLVEVGDAEYSVEDGQMTVSYDGNKLATVGPKEEIDIDEFLEGEDEFPAAWLEVDPAESIAPYAIYFDREVDYQIQTKGNDDYVIW